jgi:hypothetical protein
MAAFLTDRLLSPRTVPAVGAYPLFALIGVGAAGLLQ